MESKSTNLNQFIKNKYNSSYTEEIGKQKQSFRIKIDYYPYHTELIKIKYLENKILEEKVNYRRCLFFFCGFHQKCSKYVKKYKKLLESDDEYYGIKIILVEMKSYIPDNTVQFFFSEEQLYQEKEIFSYYRAYRHDDGLTVKTILFDAEVDKRVLELIIKEYNYLNNDWNNFMFAGFSMGSRYAVHICELLNANIFCLMIMKTYMMVYFKGQSSYLNEFIQNKLHLITEENKKCESFKDTFYYKKYNNQDDIDKVDQILFNIHKSYYDKGYLNHIIDNAQMLKYNFNSQSFIANSRVYARYSLNDDFINCVLDETLEKIQNNFTFVYLSFDYDSENKHRINSALSLLGKNIKCLLHKDFNFN